MLTAGVVTHASQKKSFKAAQITVLLIGILAFLLLAPGMVWADTQEGDNANSFRYSNGVPVEASAEARGTAEQLPQGFLPLAAPSYSTSRVAATGIDVSEHQGNINWDNVKKSGKVDFVIIRCGYGDDTKKQDDKYWLRNVKECRRVGIPFGIYIYSYANNTTRATSEANHVLRCLKEAGLSPSRVAYPIYFDMEDKKLGTNKNNLANMAKTFCNKISAAGYTPGVYANTYWWTTYLTNGTFDNYEKWVAQYASRCTYTKDYRLWQYTSSGSVSGINGKVDMNYDYGPAGAVKDTYSEPRTAYARTLADGEYYFTTLLNGYSVMDIKGGSTADSANLQLYTTNKSNAQRFKVTRDNQTGFYTIVNKGSGKALGLKEERDNTYGTNVAQYTLDNDDDSQKWIITRNSDGTYTFKAAVNTSFALNVSGSKTANGTNLALSTSNNSTAQKFRATSTTLPSVRTSDTVTAGLYTMMSKINKSKVVEIRGASTSNGVQAQINASANNQGQVFRFEKASNGFYYLINVKSGKALEVRGGGLASGAIVQQASKANADRQFWSLKNNQDGSYSFQSRVNGLMLTVSSSSAANGAVLQTNAASNSNAQKFLLDNKTNDTKTIAPGAYTIRVSAGSSFTLDVKGGSTKNSANVQLYRTNSSPAQTFVLSYDSNTGYYTIKNLRSGKMLDAKGNKAGNKVNVQQYSQNSGLGQKWIIARNSDGSYAIKSAINESYVLDINGGKIRNSSNVQLYRANGSKAQKFRFNKAVFSRTIQDGTYNIRSGINSSYAIDVKGASKANRANVQLYRASSSQAQKFRVKYDPATGYYTITNVRSGRALDANGAKMKNKTNIQQYTANNGWAQKWIITKNRDNTYTIKAALNPSFVVDVNGGKAKNSRNIQLYRANSSKAQKFRFVATK